jgi:hypothetical protein
MERFQPLPFAGAAPTMPDNGTKAFHEGRLKTFPSPQAVASVAPPWDPAGKVWATGGGGAPDQMAQIRQDESCKKLAFISLY